jgi:hypothetical protein
MKPVWYKSKIFVTLSRIAIATLILLLLVLVSSIRNHINTLERSATALQSQLNMLYTQTVVPQRTLIAQIDDARSLGLANAAQAAYAEGDSELALALALRGLTGWSSPEQVQGVVAQVGYSPGVRLRLHNPDFSVQDVAVSPTGRWGLAAYMSTEESSGQVVLWDLRTRQRRFSMAHRSGWDTTVAFIDNGKSALYITNSGEVYELIQPFE